MYLLGSSSTPILHQPNCSFTPSLHLKGWTSLGAGDSVLCLMPLGQALSQLPVRDEQGVVAVQASSSVCFAGKLNTVLKHTHTHTRPPQGAFLAKYFCSCHLPVQSKYHSSPGAAAY